MHLGDGVLLDEGRALKGTSGNTGDRSYALNGFARMLERFPPIGGKITLECAPVALSLLGRLALVLVVPDSEAEPRLLERCQVAPCVERADVLGLLRLSASACCSRRGPRCVHRHQQRERSP